MSGWRLLLLGVLSVTASAAPAQVPRFLDRTVSDWMAQLGSPEAKARRSAAFALGQLGPSAAASVPKLVQALTDSDPTVADAAACALGEMGSSAERAVPALLTTLANTAQDVRVRRSAACALGSLKADSLTARTALIAALDDPQATIRQNAAWALGRLNPMAATMKALSARLGDREAVVRRDVAGALAEMGAEAHAALPALVAQAGSESDPLVREVLFPTLVNLAGPEDGAVVPALSAMLDEADPERERAAALALGNVGGAPAAPAVRPLRKALSHPDLTVRRQASAALANVGAKAAPAVPDLIVALEDADTDIRANAALALGRIGKDAEPAIKALGKALAAKEPDKVRTHAAEALGQIGNFHEVIPDLLRVLKEDPLPKVRQRAVWALGIVGDLRGSGAADALEAVLAEDKPESRIVRYEAARYLAYRLRDKASDRVLDVLEIMMDDQRLEVYHGTGTKVSSGGAESTGGAVAVKENSGGDGRRLAVEALGQLGRKAKRDDVLRSLEKASKSEDPLLREAVRDALRRIQGDAK